MPKFDYSNVWTKQLIRVALFCMVFLLLVKNLPIQSLLSALHSFNPTYLIPALLLLLLKYVLMSFRWMVASLGTTSKPPLWFSIREFNILFLEMMIPLPNSEDLLRIAFMRSSGTGVSSAVKTIILIRVTGLIVLASLLISLVVFGNIPAPLTIKSHYLWLAIAFIIVLVLFYKHLVQLLAWFLSKVPRLGVRVEKILRNGVPANVKPNIYVKLLTLGLAVPILQAGCLWFLLVGFETEVHLIDLLMLTPFMTLSFILPLSIQGFGLPEASIAFLLPYYGVEASIAASVGGVHLCIYTSLLAFGGLLFVFDQSLKLKKLKSDVLKLTQVMKDEK